MHAADVIETLPTALPDDDILSAVQMVSRQGLPGLVVADEQGELIGCMSSVDLLRAALPHYFLDDPGLVHVMDEVHADRVAAAMSGTRVRDVLTWGPSRIPRVGPRAKAVELAVLMVRRQCPFALVEREGGGILGVVTANRLLGLLATAAEAAVAEDPPATTAVAEDPPATTAVAEDSPVVTTAPTTPDDPTR
ncbi:CBS domain-containing protein [Streptomyces sp. CC219B]|uniref:CBS domain-containing protein n=1 Tax=Streptomyces sp. CC219B TaxID=3044574 RepID=UPI0024A8D19C|nr:CBS domain-containing protein [Streptomyces sp. CC219B]